VPQQQFGSRFGERTARSRGNNLLLRKTVLTSHIRYKNEIILAPDVVNENEFLLAKKYLSMKGVFLVENRILDNVGMSLPSAQQTAQTQVRTCTDVFGRQAVGLGKHVK
jgi:hypothetical protein